MTRVMDLPSSKSLSSSAIYKNRHIGNFMYMSCHFIAHNSLNFQGPNFLMALVMNLLPVGMVLVQNNLESNSDMKSA
jgi:hypothetical protein